MKSASVDILKFAKYLIAFFQEKGDYISNKKLQKLLYYVQGWNLAYFDDPLFSEVPEAWAHGPVYPVVYHEYKENTWSPIILESSIFSEDISKILAESNYPTENIDLLDSILRLYGVKSAFELEMMTHKEGSPWKITRGDISEFAICDTKISLNLLQSFFKLKMQN